MADVDTRSPTASPVDPFKWACLGAAVIAVAWLGWCVNDLRLQFQQSAQTLNEDLPRILANTKAGTETLKVLSQDIRELRDLAGVNTASKDKSLVRYADSLLDFLEKQDAKIGKKNLIGRSLKKPVDAKVWVVGARREAVYLSFRVRSKPQMLDKLCTAITGRDFYIQFEGEQPVTLIDWLKRNHPETGALEQ